MSTTPTQNQLELYELIQERDRDRRVDGFQKLSNQDVEQLIRLGHAILKMASTDFREWFLNSLRKELRVRLSEGEIERGFYSMPFDAISDEELGELALTMDCFRDMDVISDAGAALLRRMHLMIQMHMAYRLENKAEGNIRLLTSDQVCRLLGIEKASMARLIAQGKLPKPVKILPKVHRWRHDKVMECLESMK